VIATPRMCLGEAQAGSQTSRGAFKPADRLNLVAPPPFVNERARRIGGRDGKVRSVDPEIGSALRIRNTATIWHMVRELVAEGGPTPQVRPVATSIYAALQSPRATLSQYWLAAAPATSMSSARWFHTRRMWPQPRDSPTLRPGWLGHLRSLRVAVELFLGTPAPHHRHTVRTSRSARSHRRRTRRTRSLRR